MNPKNSTCAVPTRGTLLIFSGGELLGHSGGPTLRIVSEQSLLVKGQSFSPGPVVLWIDTPGGAKIAILKADAKEAFSVTITVEKFSGRSHKLVASAEP